jgi:hypothetical protein
VSRRLACQSRGGFLAISREANARTRAEVEQDRQNAPRFAAAGRQSELAEDARDVLLHRPRRDDERLGDPRVGAAFGHQLENLALARRQVSQRVVPAPFREQGGDDDRIDRRPTGAEPRHGVDEVLDVRDPVFEQISRPLSGVREQLQRQPDLDVLGQDKYADIGVLGAYLERRLQPLVAVGRWKPDVDDGDVGRVAPYFQEKIVCGLAGLEHLEPVLAQQSIETLAQQNVLCDDTRMCVQLGSELRPRHHSAAAAR